MWIKTHKARKVISNESSCKPSNKMMEALQNATSSLDFASPITPSFGMHPTIRMVGDTQK